jgi:hypothetical protein
LNKVRIGQARKTKDVDPITTLLHIPVASTGSATGWLVGVRRSVFAIHQWPTAKSQWPANEGRIGQAKKNVALFITLLFIPVASTGSATGR